jgi:hypothetical protein
MSPTPPQLPPANWYPDPEQHEMSRYWDGAQWTDFRRPANGAATMPPPPTGDTRQAGATATLVEERPAAAPSPAAAPEAQSRKNPVGRAGMVLAIVALVLGAIPFVGFLSWIIAILGFVLGLVALRKKFLGKGAAITAMILAPIAVISGFTTAVNAATGHTTTASTVTSVADSAPPAASPTTAAASTPAAKRAVAAPAKPESSLPRSERRFISIVKTAADKIENTSSSLKEAKYRGARDAAACGVLTDNEAEGWVGTVTDIGANGDGYGYISVEVSDGITVQTWNNAFSDIGDNTLVKPSKPFFDRMTNLEEGDKVSFSGTFLRSDRSCLRGANITKTFYGLTPEFLMRFSDIRKK